MHCPLFISNSSALSTYTHYTSVLYVDKATGQQCCHLLLNLPVFFLALSIFTVEFPFPSIDQEQSHFVHHHTPILCIITRKFRPLTRKQQRQGDECLRQTKP